jgi:hypothetical protein
VIFVLSSRSRIWLPAAIALLLALRPANAGKPASPHSAPHSAPRPGYVLAGADSIGGLTVERWASATSPAVSPAGMCDCLVVVYQGPRRRLTLGTPDEMAAITVVPPSGQDLNRDGAPELVVHRWSGGAHCCFRTSVYSMGRVVRTLLSLDSGNCGPGTFADVDSDGVLEFETCDDHWSYKYCDFAHSPFPAVVFAYVAARRSYRPATPRFAAAVLAGIERKTSEAEAAVAGAPSDAGAQKCAVLKPALDLMYAGRMQEGEALIRTLYRGADLDSFVAEVASSVRARPLWVAR